MLCMGGMDKRAQIELVQKQGVHIVVATPGRLRDLLSQKKMNLNICRFFCLDEVGGQARGVLGHGWQTDSST